MKQTNLFAIAVLILFVSSLKLNAQNSSLEDMIKEGKTIADNAYKMYDRNLFLKAREVFEQAYNSDKSNPLPLYHLTYIDEKLLEMSLRKGNEDLFDKYYDGAVKNAEQLSQTNDWESEGKTILAAIYTYKIANSPMSAISLSPKVHGLLDDAQKVNDKNPRSYIIRGIMKYNTPGIFGGSYEEAAKNFSKAVSLFEKQDIIETLQPTWGYLESLAWLGRSLEQLDNFESAKFAYQKALSVEPEFSWVKYSLLPNLEKKINK